MQQRILSGLVTIAALACAAPAFAQRYVYAATGFAVFRGQHLTQLPTSRLVTIDPASGQAIASLWLTGCTNATGIAVRADGLRVFVSCASQGVVVAVDPVAKQIVATRTFPQVAGGVAITPSGDRLIVTLGGGLPAEVLDPTSLATIGAITGAGGPVSGNQQPVVISNDGLTAYIAESLSSSGRLVVASLAGFTVTNTIDFGADNIRDLALTGDGLRVVVRHHTGKVSVVSTATNTVDGTVTLPADAALGGIAADAGARAFAGAASAVHIIDLASKSITGQFAVAWAQVLEMNAAGNRLYAGVGVVPTPAVVAVDSATGGIVSSTVVKGSIAGLVTPASSTAVAPDPCTYSTNFRSASFSSPPPRQSPAGSSDWRIDVIALPDRCTWTAQSDVPWITLEYTEGAGPDNVGITIAPNTTGAVRTGNITAGGQTLTISQAGCTNPIIFFERPVANSSVSPPVQVSGWAIDTCAPSGTGIAAVSIGPTTNYGRARPDVGAAFAPQFTNSGFEFFDRTETLPGPRDITVSFLSTITERVVTGTVRVNMLPTFAPFGTIDTPAEGTPVSGDMALTGWVMDDVHAIGPLVYRDALPGENSSAGTPGKVFVGVTTRVSGARPDVEAAYPTLPENDRAGYGLMVLTNALPNDGNGTFTFHVLVRDTFHQTWLGPRTVTIDNASSPLPFGAIDTPASGETVSGVIAVQGWALTPGNAMIPVDGSTIDVIVDGVVVGQPSYNHARPDVQALFPGYTNSSAPGGFFMLDTRTMTNGLHTIAWVVRDNAGNAKGIGSRFFTVQNP